MKIWLKYLEDQVGKIKIKRIISTRKFNHKKPVFGNTFVSEHIFSSVTQIRAVLLDLTAEEFYYLKFAPTSGEF